MSKGEVTRQRIVEAAAGLFNQRGFENASLSELMEATGLEKGGIYRHFASKEELATAAFDYAWGAATQARMHDLDETRTASTNSSNSLRTSSRGGPRCRVAVHC